MVSCSTLEKEIDQSVNDITEKSDYSTVCQPTGGCRFHCIQVPCFRDHHLSLKITCLQWLLYKFVGMQVEVYSTAVVVRGLYNRAVAILAFCQPNLQNPVSYILASYSKTNFLAHLM